MRPLPLLKGPNVQVSDLAGHATPFRFPSAYFTLLLPAISTWFTSNGVINLQFFESHLSENDLASYVTVEATTAPFSSMNSVPTTFERVSLPFHLLLHHLASPIPPPTLPHLYLAQTPLMSLPIPLHSSLPTPRLIRHVRGLLPANLWLGHSLGINTPLHKDPHSNIFVQLVGRKRMRIFPIHLGTKLMGKQAQPFREEDEMMVGHSREKTEKAVWEDDSEDGWEVDVKSGDGVFIPKGWWHAVKGSGTGVGGSVNWWFQ